MRIHRELTVQLLYESRKEGGEDSSAKTQLIDSSWTNLRDMIPLSSAYLSPKMTDRVRRWSSRCLEVSEAEEDESGSRLMNRG